MKRLLFAALLTLLPAVAQAGVGTIWYTGGALNSHGYYSSVSWLPTLDFHNKDMLVQLNAADLLFGLPAKSVNLAGDVFATSRNMKVSDEVDGVFQYGGRLELETKTSFKTVNGALLGEVRIGAQTVKGMGVGIYVVPGLGLAYGTARSGNQKVDLAMSGQLQISAWFRKD